MKIRGLRLVARRLSPLPPNHRDDQGRNPPFQQDRPAVPRRNVIGAFGRRRHGNLPAPRPRGLPRRQTRWAIHGRPPPPAPADWKLNAKRFTSCAFCPRMFSVTYFRFAETVAWTSYDAGVHHIDFGLKDRVVTEDLLADNLPPGRPRQIAPAPQPPRTPQASSITHSNTSERLGSFYSCPATSHNTVAQITCPLASIRPNFRARRSGVVLTLAQQLRRRYGTRCPTTDARSH